MVFAKSNSNYFQFLKIYKKKWNKKKNLLTYFKVLLENFSYLKQENIKDFFHEWKGKYGKYFCFSLLKFSFSDGNFSKTKNSYLFLNIFSVKEKVTSLNQIVSSSFTKTTNFYSSSFSSIFVEFYFAMNLTNKFHFQDCFWVFCFFFLNILFIIILDQLKIIFCTILLYFCIIACRISPIATMDIIARRKEYHRRE